MGAAFGAAGQRCMAITTVVFVGDDNGIMDAIVEKAKRLKVGAGCEPGTEVGPVISPAAKARIESLIASGVHAGAHLLLDGRGVKPTGYEKGNFVGPTLLAGVTPEMECYQQEIFGPAGPFPSTF